MNLPRLLAALPATAWLALAFAAPPGRLGAQTRIALDGFGVRGGVDFNDGQGIFGTTLDLGQIATPRLRLRPAVEVGVWKGANSYTGSGELVYRFTGDQ